jgi:hypothetical protein
MNSPRVRRLILLISLIVFCSVIAAGIYSQALKSQKKSKDQPRTYAAAKVTNVPKVISGVNGLEITSVSLISEGTPEAALNIDVTNKRDDAVMALDFIAGGTTYSGLRIDGLLQEDNPLVIIAPHSLKTFTWSLGGIIEGEAITLAAAVFSDGKEEGNQLFLEGIKKARVKYQEKQRADKTKNGGQK